MPRKKKDDMSVKKTAEQTEEENAQKEYLRRRENFRKATSHHVLKLEARMSEDVKRRVFALAENLRVASNVLTGLMNRNLKALCGQQKYQDLRKEYGKLKNELEKLDDEDSPESNAIKQRKDAVTAEMEAMQRECDATWDFARKQMEKIAKDKGISSIFALSAAEDVWKGAEAVLYGNGKSLSFKKRGDLPEIRAKQIERGIPIKTIGNELDFSIELGASPAKIDERFAVEKERLEKEKGRHLTQYERDTLKSHLRHFLKQRYHFSVIHKRWDTFAKDEIGLIISFLSNPNMEKDAIEHWVKTNQILDTFRPCYASLKCEVIRNKLRVWCCITISGSPCSKKNRDGSPRHSYGKGIMGVDLGPQSVEMVTRKSAEAANLAERSGHSTFETESKEKELLRAMDRSRRATNPQYYNPNGTIKKGKKHWKKSNRYKKLQSRHKNLCRKNAVNREYAINEMVNRIRGMADEIHIEQSNVKSMQKRAKKKDVSAQNQNTADVAVDSLKSTDIEKPQIPVDENIQEPVKQARKSKKKNNRKKCRGRGQGKRKRFGRSILHRCPGYFYQRLKQVFESTGGSFKVVDIMFRASQYDHIADVYIKKKLSQRLHEFADGRTVQRDLYSAFLLMCALEDLSAPDRNLCIKLFEEFLRNHDECLKRLEKDHIKICNF